MVGPLWELEEKSLANDNIITCTTCITKLTISQSEAMSTEKKCPKAQHRD